MVNKTIFILGIVSLLASCGDTDADSSPESRLERDKSIVVESENRNYHLLLPDQPETARIVMVLHGHGGSADQVIGLEGTKAPHKVWMDIALRENLILVVPDGKQGSDDKKGWNDCRSDARTNPPTDDTQFLTQLLDQLINEHTDGTPKVYIVGTSNGGFMTQRLADEEPDRLDAIAIIVASRPANSLCPNPPAPLPVLFMNGTDDPILPYDGGSIITDRGAVLSTDATIAHWIARNQTLTSAEETSIANGNSSDGSTVRRLSYRNGASGTVVEHYEVVGGGHTEPSIVERFSEIYKLLAGSQNGDIEMAEEVWQFFNRY